MAKKKQKTKVTDEATKEVLSDKTVKAPETKESTEPKNQEGDNFDDSFYKGKGGCYTLNDKGQRVPVKEK